MQNWKHLAVAAVAVSVTFGATIAGAQTLSGVKLEPAQPMAGQPVTATIALDVADMANCGMRFYWGDGATVDIKVTDKNAIPYKLTHTYAKGGDYRTMAEGKKVTSHLACSGKNVVTMLKVAAPPPPPVAAAPAAAASAAKTTKASGPSCPEGWKLNAKSVSKKTGAYGCTAKAGTATPEKKPACPGDLTYYENSKKGQLGCRV